MGLRRQGVDMISGILSHSLTTCEDRVEEKERG